MCKPGHFRGRIFKNFLCHWSGSIFLCLGYGSSPWAVLENSLFFSPILRYDPGSVFLKHAFSDLSFSTEHTFLIVVTYSSWTTWYNSLFLNYPSLHLWWPRLFLLIATYLDLGSPSYSRSSSNATFFMLSVLIYLHKRIPTAFGLHSHIHSSHYILPLYCCYFRAHMISFI